MLASFGVGSQSQFINVEDQLQRLNLEGPLIL